jgi:hypothetical protein
VSDSFRRARFFFGLFTLHLLVGPGIVLAPGNLVALVLNTQVLNALATRRSVLGDAANRPVLRPTATVCVAAVGMLALAVVLLHILGRG